MSDAKMTMATALLPEFDQEMAGARKTLERVPEAALAWKPHPKSFAMGELMTHLATVPGWATVTLEQDSFDMSPGGEPLKMPEAKTVAEALGLFDEGVAKARAAIAAASDEVFAGSWTLLSNGAQVLTMPRAAVIRGFIMSHLVHHRAQLGLYLRMNDVPVPSLYGPSADEGSM